MIVEKDRQFQRKLAHDEAIAASKRADAAAAASTDGTTLKAPGIPTLLLPKRSDVLAGGGRGLLALWPRVVDASRYEVQVGYVLSGSWRTCGGTEGECTFLIQGLEHQQRYVCRVRAFDENCACWGPYSVSSQACRYEEEEKYCEDNTVATTKENTILANVASSSIDVDKDVDTTSRRKGSNVTSSSTTTADPSVSNVAWPTNVTFSSMNDMGLLARWNPVAHATAYEVQVGSASRFAVGWRTVGGTSTCQYLVQTLKPNVEYVCRVRAFLSSSGGWGSYSSWSNASSFSEAEKSSVPEKREVGVDAATEGGLAGHSDPSSDTPV